MRVNPLALVALLVLAFAAGLGIAQFIGREAAAPDLRDTDRIERDRRAVFSPRVRRDPFFVQEQRKGVEAMEAHCRETGEMCPESRAARESFERLLADG